MNTKTIHYYVDLHPGWQDQQFMPFFFQTPMAEKSPETKRFRITVELPCIGGSSDIDGTSQPAVVEVEDE